MPIARVELSRRELEACELAIRCYLDSALPDTPARELEAMRRAHARILRELEARGW